MLEGASNHKKYWILTQDYTECEYCKKKWSPGMKKFSTCGRCRETRYCSKDCQIKHWLSPPPREGHKLQCLFFRNLFENNEASMDPGSHNFNVIGNDGINKIFDLTINQLPKDSALDDFCGCLDEWNIHSTLSAHTGLCSRLGCYKPSLYVSCQNFKFVRCKIRPEILHEIGVKYFCTNSCRKATSIREPTGTFWKTQKMEDSPVVNYKKLTSLFGKPLEEILKKLIGYFPSGDQYIADNTIIKLIAIELFIDVYASETECSQTNEMINLLGLNYDLMSLPPVDKIDQSDLVVRLIQVIEQLCFSSFEFSITTS